MGKRFMGFNRKGKLFFAVSQHFDQIIGFWHI
jgi:hypothetical protein